jgi:hypothetical protein
MVIQPQDNIYSLSEHENSIGCKLTKWWLNITVFVVLMIAREPL